MEFNRDLLYVHTNDSKPSVSELEILHKILFNIETMHKLSCCVEIIDFNKIKIIKKIHLVEQILRQPKLKPFQFVNNLN
jgi:hypothetical protein